MNEHPLITRLRRAHFAVLPLPNSMGADDGLLLWRWAPDRACLDIVGAWHDTHAVSVRLPPQRNWADPFKPSCPLRPPHVDSLADIVDTLLREGRHHSVGTGPTWPS